MESDAGRVLVVDDVAVNRKIIEAGLAALGCETVLTASGREAVDLFHEREFDLVLLDLMMPEMDGFQVLEQIRDRARLRHVPVVVVSAMDEADTVARCLKLGADDYLAKPIDVTVLRARVASCIEKKRLRDHEAEHTKAIDAERRRADRILENILPLPVAQELRATHNVEPRRYENVAVLFADVTGFTTYCSTRDPREIFSHLQEMTVACEAVCAKHQMLKIKTVGDCFMATGNMLKPIERPVENAVRCALEMLTLVRSLDAGWDLHAGIHVGPVIAGMVGFRQYLFDVFGDTVNTAAHLQGFCPPASVCISRDAWETVNGTFTAAPAGSLRLKGERTIEVFQIQS